MKQYDDDVHQVLYTPVCDDALKPHEGKSFKSLDDAMEFYDNYANNVGFDTRIYGSKSVDNIITWRYVVCSREGKKHTEQDDMSNARDGYINKRRRRSKRCECKARAVFKYISDIGYVVDKFAEQHNHEMVEAAHKRFMRVNRKLDPMHQQFIVDCAKASIGPTLTYKLLNELLGGYDYVGCTVTEVRNFTRDMKAYIEGSDAQMLLNEMSRKKEVCPSFVYEFEVDNEDKLKRLFWSDAVSRKNFNTYGDVVAFDTTYSTNKYCMIFAPFTGKDNHGKRVTFAAGLLSNEDADSFSWLFKNFLDSMGTAPKLIITDQDLGMKAAVERVLTNTRHRWCTWHIMLKLLDKVSKELHANEDFKKALNACVWSELIEPDVFEEQWFGIMKQFGLTEVDWIKTMFQQRSFWVLAYFRDFHMGGLLRTTSISECENNFFKRYTKSRSNLVEFIMSYNHALEAQRNQSCKLNYMDETMISIMATGVSIEKHASSIYTDSMFKVVQAELVEAYFHCRIADMNALGSTEYCKVTDSLDISFSVVYNGEDDSYFCGCKMFSRVGLLCRHIFFVMKNNKVKMIPDKYVVGRWLKSSMVKPVHGVLVDEVNGVVADEVQELSVVDGKQQKLNNLYSLFFGIVRKVDGNSNALSTLISTLEDADKSLSSTDDPRASYILNKKKIIEEYYGAQKPETIKIHPPNPVKTKGSGRRIHSTKEKAVKEWNKPLRRCARCNQMYHHDARNCDKIKELEKLKSKSNNFSK